MKDVMVGRVDLVRALTSGGTELQDAVAHLLGFEREEETPPPPQEPEHETKRPPEPPPEPESAPIRFDVPFWLAHDFVAREPRSGDEITSRQSSTIEKSVGPVAPGRAGIRGRDPDTTAPVLGVLEPLRWC